MRRMLSFVFVFFLTSALQCIEMLQRQESDSFHKERLCRELNEHSWTPSAFHTLCDDRDVRNLLGSLYRCFWNFLHEHYARQRSTEETTNLAPPTTLTGQPGWPRYSIATEQISHCVSIGMSWQRIASCFGISRRTLYRHKRLGVEPLRYSVFSNQDLDRVVTQLLHKTPNAGEAYILGGLRLCGLRMQCWWVRQSLPQVDPIGWSFRCSFAIHRRVYSVHAPNQLW